MGRTAHLFPKLSHPGIYLSLFLLHLLIPYVEICFFTLNVKPQVLPAPRIPPNPLKMELIVPPQCFHKNYSWCQTVSCIEQSMASAALLV